jgi:hypothetical protein
MNEAFVEAYIRINNDGNLEDLRRKVRDILENSR